MVNGDVFKWRFLWPNIAEYFGLKPAEPQDQPLNLEELMKDKEAVWDEIVDKHGLKVSDLVCLYDKDLLLSLQI